MPLLPRPAAPRSPPCVPQMPLPSHTGRILVEDQGTADELFQLAKAASNAKDFAARLQQAGLMLDDASSGSGSSSGGSSNSAVSTGGSKASTGSGKAGTDKADGAKGGGKLKVPLLSRDLARSHARDGIIIVTWANYHFFDFVLNWVRCRGVRCMPGLCVCVCVLCWCRCCWCVCCNG